MSYSKNFFIVKSSLFVFIAFISAIIPNTFLCISISPYINRSLKVIVFIIRNIISFSFSVSELA